MKTIDEAMTLLTATLKHPSEAAATFAAMTNEIEKRESLAQEIRHNPTVIDFVNCYVAEVGPLLNFDVHALAISIFINGVLIGIEMEKQEL